ncbi:hypothetical protein H7J76_25630 [Mycolicibacterium fortuitum]|nr:hypothetical protein [Mycolicibacterium fortuitum]MCV7142550.1 hypothetical protein [Mycolicibacterium fortuitum]
MDRRRLRRGVRFGGLLGCRRASAGVLVFLGGIGGFVLSLVATFIGGGGACVRRCALGALRGTTSFALVALLTVFAALVLATHLVDLLNDVHHGAVLPIGRFLPML